jgi:hypothetical protein
MENAPIQYRFIDIQIIMKTLQAPSREGITGIFHFDIRVDTKVKAENNLVIPFVEVKIRDGDNPDYLATFVIACLFDVKDFASHVNVNENGLHVVPPHLVTVLHQISISTARGIIYSELRGTYLNSAIMPVLLMNEFKEDGKPLTHDVLVFQQR